MQTLDRSKETICTEINENNNWFLNAVQSQSSIVIDENQFVNELPAELSGVYEKFTGPPTTSFNGKLEYIDDLK